MRWAEHVLSAGGKKAADRLSPILKGQFSLAGGTALALIHGHRISLDLDLFSSANKLSEGERKILIDGLKASGPIEITENKDRTLHCRMNGTRVSFFHYPYATLREPTKKWRGIPVADLSDIGAMKLSAIVGRGSKKDFIDIFFLAKEVGLSSILEDGCRRFADHPDFFLQACKALIYFDDAEKEPFPRMLTPIDWEDIKTFLDREVRRILSTRLSKT